MAFCSKRLSRTSSASHLLTGRDLGSILLMSRMDGHMVVGCEVAEASWITRANWTAAVESTE
jgi:hypothetical protein